MTNAVLGLRARQWQQRLARQRALEQLPRRPVGHQLVLTPISDCTSVAAAEHPRSVTLVRPDPKNPAADLLFLDRVPVASDMFRFDPVDHRLSWSGHFGGGHLSLSFSHDRGYGAVGPALTSQSVTAGARAVFDCDVALDAGATYVTAGGHKTALAWDSNSAAWKNANWIANRLRLSYTTTPGGPMSPSSFSISFEDLQTQAVPFTPADDSYHASVSLDSSGPTMRWNLDFQSSDTVDPDTGSNPPAGPVTVFPNWLMAQEDAAAASLEGAFEIDDPSATTKLALVGLRGKRAAATVAGYYATKARAMPFAVFDGKLHISDQPIAASTLRGNVLQWSGLDTATAALVDLPVTGQIEFSTDGNRAFVGTTAFARRLGASEALAALDTHKVHHAGTTQRIANAHALLLASSLDVPSLMAMSPYSNVSGAWVDEVQAAVTSDLSTIMNSFIPQTMWDTVFPNTPQQPLTGDLATIAATPVAKYPGSPSTWYAKVATAVLTRGLADGNDAVCLQLNGPRAAAWLKTEIATSPVYHAHGQLLFHKHWAARFPLFADYLSDQASPPAGTNYDQQIDTQVAAQVTDIQSNVIVTADSPPNLIADMTKGVQADGAYAKSNKLYWAFAFQTYNTAPAILANLGAQLGSGHAGADGSMLTRLIQQNSAILTALDPSGYFASRYMQSLNEFMGANMLGSMVDFTDGSMDSDLIKDYLKELVAVNLASQDVKLQAAGRDLQAIIAQQDADDIIKSSIDALRGFSSSVSTFLEFPYIAKRFVGWLSTTYPKLSKVASFFGTCLLTGVGALAVTNLFTSFKSWDKLTLTQRATAVIDAVQLGVQLIAAAVQRGVRVYAMWGVDGLTAAQRAAGMSRVMFAGEARSLDVGLTKLGNSTARWLGDTEGSMNMMLAGSEDTMRAVMVNGAAASSVEASWASKILGRNLDEFVSTRLGPLFIFLGICVSVWSIANGDTGLSLANDILGIVGGALMIFATIGGWYLVAYRITAGVLCNLVSFAGPLAVVLALIGIAILLYETFKKQPNPIQDFVDNWASKEKLTVTNERSSIDYAVAAVDKTDSNAMKVGFTLTGSGTVLAVGASGAVSAEANPAGGPTLLPEHVWQVVTDGVGVSTILSVLADAKGAPEPVILSRMDDGSIRFCPKTDPGKTPAGSPSPAKVVTQRWVATPKGSATTSSDHLLRTLDLSLSPVAPDTSGNYDPANASGFLSASTVGQAAMVSATPETWTLAMSRMGPNFMRFNDPHFILGSTIQDHQTFGVAFGVQPSEPITFALTGTPPVFLDFDSQGGALNSNGKVAATAMNDQYTLAADNGAGKASCDFHIVVA